LAFVPPKARQAGLVLPKLHNNGECRAGPDLRRLDPPHMNHASPETFAQLALWLSLLLGLLMVGVLVVQRFRGGAADRGSMAKEVMSNFQEMRERGDINDADYRKIKSVLGAQLHSELKDGKDKL
jgi:hypothetical protein